MGAETPSEPAATPSAIVRVPKRLIVALVILFGVVAGAALFGAGYIAGDSSSNPSSSNSVGASCSTDEILRAARDWTEVQRRYDSTEEGSAEEEKRLDEAVTADEHLEATLYKCFP